MDDNSLNLKLVEIKNTSLLDPYPLLLAEADPGPKCTIYEQINEF